MKKHYFIWLYSFFAICIMMIHLSCTKDDFGDNLLNESEPNSEFLHTITIDAAEAQLVEILSDMEVSPPVVERHLNRER